MCDQQFKFFYKLDIERRKLLEELIKKGRSEWVKKLLSDHFYEFNYNFIFDFVYSVIKEREIHRYVEDMFIK